MQQGFFLPVRASDARLPPSNRLHKQEAACAPKSSSRPHRRVAASLQDLADLESSLERSTTGQSVADQTFRVRPLQRTINWYKWEGRWFERWQEKQKQAEGSTQEAPLPATFTDPYFQRWASPAAHQLYLEDAVAMGAFRRAILGNEELFRGKVVLDVGAGLGVTAMMAAKAGAAHVYAVEASAAAEQAAKAVAANGLEAQVTVIQGRVEAVQLPVPKVDIIVCDFMGPMLLGGGMLPSLLHARDRWLAPGGLMFPDRAELLMLAVDDREYLAAERRFWSSMYGLDLTCITPAAIKYARQDSLARKALALTPPTRLLSLDLYQAGAAQVAADGFSKSFQLACARDEGRVCGLLAYWEASFTGRGKVKEPEVLRTGPAHEETHWRQTIFSFPRVLRLAKGQVLAGKVACRPGGAQGSSDSSSSAGSAGSSSSSSAGPRDLVVDVEIEFQGAAARQVYVVQDGGC